MTNTASANKPGDRNQNNLSTSDMSPELVRKVTEKVYALLLEDLKIENERRRLRAPQRRHR